MAEKKTIEAKITADATDFNNKVDKATKKSKSFASTVGYLGKALAITTGAVAAAATAVFFLTNRVAEAGDNFQKMSLRTGISAENLSRLDFAAKRSGANLQIVESALRYMTKVMFDSTQGLATAKRGFDNLGVSVTDEHGKLRNSVDVLKDVSAGLSKMTNKTKQIATAQYIFGSRFGTQLLPMLTSGTEGLKDLMDASDKLGYTWSTKDANAAADFEDRLTDLKSSFDGLKRRLLINTFPIFESAMIGATTFITNINDAKDKTDTFSEAIMKAGLFGMALFEGLNITIEDIKYTYLKVRKAIENAPIKVKIKIEEWKDTLKGLFRSATSNTFSGESGFNGGGGGGSSAEGDITDIEEKHKAHLKQIQGAYDKAVDSFVKMIQSSKDLGSALKGVEGAAEGTAKNAEKAANAMQKWHTFNIEGISSNRLLTYIGSLKTKTTLHHVVEIQLKWDGRVIKVKNDKQSAEEIGRAVLRQLQSSRALAFGTGG